MALTKQITKVWPIVFLLLFASTTFGAEALVAIKPDIDWIRGQVQDGAIIDVCPDGFQWGNLEKKKFIVIKVPNKMLEYRDEVRAYLIEKYDKEENPIINGRLKYVFDYWNHFSGEELKKVRTKKEDNIYTKTEINLNNVKVKDANNTTIGNLSIISSP